jgi:hypothetical protein
MQITTCDKCDVVVDHSKDERRFKPHNILDGKAICEDCDTWAGTGYTNLVYWKFEDSPRFLGFTDGSTWNGWANIQVNKEQFKAVKKWMVYHMGLEGFNEFMKEYEVKVDENRYSFAYGCTAEIVSNKDEIIGNIYDDLFPWINDGIAVVQIKYGLDNGDVSPSLDMEFREVYERLAECVYKQLQEHNKLESEVE